MPPRAAPSPPLFFPDRAAFAVLYAIVAAMIATALVGLVVCAYYSVWLRNRVNRARPDRDIERLQQRAVAVAPPPAVVAEYRGHVRKFDVDGCPICLASFEVGEECWVIATCDHVYHESCIKEWLSKHLSCPLCRGLVQGRQAARVTLAPASS